jgi:hypothetical protein
MGSSTLSDQSGHTLKSRLAARINISRFSLSALLVKLSAHEATVIYLTSRNGRPEVPAQSSGHRLAFGETPQVPAGSAPAVRHAGHPARRPAALHLAEQPSAIPLPAFRDDLHAAVFAVRRGAGKAQLGSLLPDPSAESDPLYAPAGPGRKPGGRLAVRPVIRRH